MSNCEKMVSGRESRTRYDEIMSYDREQLAKFIYAIAYAREIPWDAAFGKEFCDKCPSTKCTTEDGVTLDLCECDFVDGKCPHGDPIMWWLNSSAEKEKNEEKTAI